MGKDAGRGQVECGPSSSGVLLSLWHKSHELQALLVEVLLSFGGLLPSPLILCNENETRN